MLDAAMRDRLERAARTAMTLLVDGDFDVVAPMTRFSVSAAELRHNVESVGKPLIDPPDEEWIRLSYLRVHDSDAESYDVVVPLWTEEGPSKVGIALRFVRSRVDTIKLTIRGFHEVDAEVTPSQTYDSSMRPRGAQPHVDDSEATPKPLERARQLPRHWQPALAAVVSRLVSRDYVGLARDGVLSYTTDANDSSIGEWIEKYPATLIELPDEAWVLAERGPSVDARDRWWVIVPLWTAEEGRSDLTMEATVWDDGNEVVVKVDNVHVM